MKIAFRARHRRPLAHCVHLDFIKEIFGCLFWNMIKNDQKISFWSLNFRNTLKYYEKDNN
jgi:hypothetical protein